MRALTAVAELNLEVGDRRLPPPASPRWRSTRTPMPTPGSSGRPTRRSVSGPTTYLDPADGRRKSRYLDEPSGAGSALVQAEVDAVWVGWGFVAERASFAQRCEEAGIIFVGPDSATIRLLGDKVTAKRMAEKADVPVVPWSGGPVDDVAQAAERGAAAGLPGGAQGDRGRRRPGHPCRPRTARTWPAAFDVRPQRGRAGLRRPGRLPRGLRPGRPARRGPGHRRRLRHHLGARRPRLQRPAAQPEGHRGVVLDRVWTRRPRQELKAAAVRLAAVAGYRNAGTVEFLVDPGDAAVPVHGGQHPAAGRAPGHRGHHRAGPGQAAAARRRRWPARRAARRRRAGTPSRPGCAPRTPSRASLPAPGRLVRLRLPTGTGRTGGLGDARGRRRRVRVRLDDRQDRRLGRRPRRGPVPAPPGAGPEHGRGRGRDDQPVLPAHPARPARGPRRAASTTAGWTASPTTAGTSRRRTRWRCWWLPSRPTTPTTAPRRPPSTSARPGAGRRCRPTVGTRVQLRYCGVAYHLGVYRTSPGTYRVRHGAIVADVAVERLDEYERRVVCGGRSHRVLAHGAARRLPDRGRRHGAPGRARRRRRGAGGVACRSSSPCSSSRATSSPRTPRSRCSRA